MKALIPYKLSKIEKEAMIQEVKRQLVKYDEKYQNDFDAMVLYTLYENFGFGEKRLKRFYKELIKKHGELRQHYQMDNVTWICIEKLKEIGVDIEEWNKEN